MTACHKRCPVLAAGGAFDGPVRCELSDCRYHCASPGMRGPLAQIRRRHVSTGDDCSLTIAARGPHSYGAVAHALGVSRAAVRRTLRRVLIKLLSESRTKKGNRK